jgi:hypothetical protein
MLLPAVTAWGTRRLVEGMEPKAPFCVRARKGALRPYRVAATLGTGKNRQEL